MSHEVYGIFVDVNELENGLVVITMVNDEPPPLRQLPAVGSTVIAVFLGYVGPGNQPRLSLRPSDVALAERGVLPDYLED